VLPLDALRIRVAELLDAGRQCRQAVVGATLPALIRDLHTSIAAGRDVAGLLELAVVLHAQGTHAWLRVMGAEVDLRALATLVARQAAEHRDEPTTMGLAMWVDGLAMLAAGDFDLARYELDSVTVAMNSSESMQVAGMLALCRSLVAAADNRPADVEAALDMAAELAERTGEGNAYWLGFGPTNVGLWRMAAVLEIGDHERAVTIAEGLDPRVHPNRSRQTAYWIDYGRALARLRGRQDHAVMALRRAETISPLHTLRNRSPGMPSGGCLCARAGMRWAGSCGGWRTGLGCRCSPSGVASDQRRRHNPPFRLAVHRGAFRRNPAAGRADSLDRHGRRRAGQCPGRDHDRAVQN
jgi:hypothetical protein